MIDNFSAISQLLKFENEGDFYFIQIIKRKKDNPGMKKDVSVIDNFFIYSNDDFFILKEKIMKLCIYHNARATIRLNKRNAEKIALQTLKITTDCIINKDFRGVKSAYLSACGQFSSDSEKKWIVDIDKPEDKIKVMDFFLDNKFEMLGFIPSKSCGHLLVKPFNPNLFTQKFPTIDLHKDSFVNALIPSVPALHTEVMAKMFGEWIFDVINKTEKTGQTWDTDSEYDKFILHISKHGKYTSLTTK